MTLSYRSPALYRNAATYRGAGGALTYRSHVPYRGPYTYRGASGTSAFPSALSGGRSLRARRRERLPAARPPIREEDEVLICLLLGGRP